MDKLPDPVYQYVSELETDTEFRLVGYLCLDEQEQVARADGEICKFQLDKLDTSNKLEHTIPFLEGLLPSDIRSNTIIDNVHIDTDCYFDIHIFQAENQSWIVFIDITTSALQQAEQQLRLDIDFLNDKRKTGS